MNRPPEKIAFFALIAAVGAVSLSGQLPIPVPGQTPAVGGGQGGGAQAGAAAAGRGGRGGGRSGRGGRGTQAAAEPVKQVVAPVPSATEVDGPGEFYETFMDDHDDATKADIPAKDTYAKFNYEAKEYFIFGTTASGAVYKTRIVIRKPKDSAKFNGLILAESMHPSGNPWVFHFTQTYAMTTGVIGLEILTSTPAGLAAANEARYKDLAVPNGAANDILAQVGALIKSDHKDNPLSGLAVRKMILAGSSASAGVAQNYLTNAHMAQRLAGMKPIYDGFMPTSANGQIPILDVPTILVPTMRETFTGNGTTQPDNDKLRVYEFAGMAHIDSRVAGGYYPDPCKYPISRYPMGAEMSIALDKLFAWVDNGVAPPHADRFYVDFNPDNKPKLDRDKGSLLALDEFGNVKGGIRNTYVDVPVKSFHVPNEGAEPRISNPNHFIAARRIGGADPDAQLCGLGNLETALPNDQLKKLYKNPKAYYNKVAQRYDELVKEGWALPVYRAMVLAEAARVTF
ncbi:MAG TPA: alpha/beta hydrolase domain-containing protein [Bryobacteraceae bacterium]|nr:alpha/beta hydrolase domain-containing protein [Bryobacteraceae bacterium]